ncbi:MAG: tetratricopeptide repeat protein, partial [Pseudomonadales bacterium]
ALKWAIEVEDIVKAESREMKENWLYLQVVLYNELEDMDNVIRVLERMVVDFPKKQYWMHLAGMYTEKEWDDRSLSAYYAIYAQGMFSKDSEVVMLSQRLLNAEVPYEAASVLERGLKDKIVEPNEKNLRLLATCYTLSQDMGKAIDAWERASQYAEDGEIFYRLAQALAQEDRHKEAVGAYDKALEDKDLKSASDAHFWLAISHMSLENWDQASKSFRSAAKLDKKLAKQTRQYIRYIAGEKKRQAALKEMLES